MSGDHTGPAATIAARVRHVESLLEQRGLVDSQELDRALEAFLARASPANGARLAARACGMTGSARGCWRTRTPRCPSWGCRWAGGCRSSG